VILGGPGKERAYEMAQQKLSDPDLWLDTPHPGLKANQTPRQALESECPSCINDVLSQLEAMA
jgi:hypothetical protein